MSFVCKYVALYVPDLRAAEDFYREVFSLDLLFRESRGPDGTWRTLRPELSWEDAAEQGIEVGMVALRRAEVVLALFPGAPAPGTVYELCIGVGPEEVGEVRSRIERTTTILEAEARLLRFQDPFGFRWAVQPADARFRSSGESAGRWLP